MIPTMHFFWSELPRDLCDLLYKLTLANYWKIRTKFEHGCGRLVNNVPCARSSFAKARPLSANALACHSIDGYTARSGVGDSMGEL